MVAQEHNTAPKRSLPGVDRWYTPPEVLKDPIEICCRSQVTSLELASLWRRLKHEFTWDGSLRDLYVERTDLEHWQALLEFLRERQYSVSYQRGGQNEPVPVAAADVFADREKTHVLSITVDGILLNSHFFSPEEIELDIDPREIHDNSRFATLCHFMCELSKCLRRDILLTHENLKGAQILVFRA